MEIMNIDDNRDMTVSPAAPEDIDRIHSIEQECNQSPWSHAGLTDELTNPRSIFRVMRKNGEIIGFACCELILDELQINNIAIHPDRQGMGLGTMLIRRLLDEATAKGATRALLEVRASNIRAIKTYKKCGFTVDGVRVGYYRNGEDAVLMSTPLP